MFFARYFWLRDILHDTADNWNKRNTIYLFYFSFIIHDKMNGHERSRDHRVFVLSVSRFFHQCWLPRDIQCLNEVLGHLNIKQGMQTCGNKSISYCFYKHLHIYQNISVNGQLCTPTHHNGSNWVSDAEHGC